MTLKKLRNLFCPLSLCLIQISILYALFFQLFGQDVYYSTIANAEIKKKIEDRINQCGPDFWISWVVFDGNKSKNKYYFQDVIGCKVGAQENEDCSYSVKDANLNSFYTENYHKIDPETYKILLNMDTGMVAYFSRPEDLQRFAAVSEAAKSANKSIEALGLTVTKNLRKNIVYVFTISKTSAGAGNCSKHEIVNILEDLALFSKEKL